MAPEWQQRRMAFGRGGVLNGHHFRVLHLLVPAILRPARREARWLVGELSAGFLCKLYLLFIHFSHARIERYHAH